MCPRCGFALPGPSVAAPATGGPVFQAAGAAPSLPAMAPPGPESLARPGATRATNGLCVASMVLGILSLIPMLGMVALILGIVGVSQAKKRAESGAGMGVAGIVLGSFFTAFYVVWFFFMLAFFNGI